MGEFVLTPEWGGNLPLYEQLYRYVVEEIRASRLGEGDKLPSKRALSAHLGVSLSTVEGAYGLLTAEGYVRSVPRSGFRVCPVLPLWEKAAQPLPAVRPVQPPVLKDCFSTSGVDAELFPHAAWARLLREAVREPALLLRGHPQGDETLRAALCSFLHQYRGVTCRPEQVVVGAGMEYLLTVLLQLFPREAAVAVEDPGYHSTPRALENLGRRWVGVPVDGLGLRPDALAASGASVVYVTPSHQFPLGVTMPVGRRTELLRWTYEREGRYIIEDDYDSEFRYASRPIGAMQGLDGGRRVVYVGTFSRSIAPSIRAAYLILPDALLGVYREKFDHGAATVSRFEQRVLSEFLSSGQYVRHLRRVGNRYRARCAALADALGAAFPGGEVRGEQAGLHLLLTLPGREDGDLVARAAAAGYRVRGLSEYGHGAPTPAGTLVLGFAGLPECEAHAAVEDLRRVFEQI